MESRSPRSGVRNSIALMLVVLALAVRVLLPPGYMASPDAGGLQLVVCTGQGAITLESQGDGHDGDQQAKDGPCLFAGLATALDHPEPAELAGPLSVQLPRDISAVSRDQCLARSLACPTPPSHAPPAAQSLIA